MINSKIKFFRTWRGDGVAIGIEGPHQDIQSFATVIYNYGGTESEPIFMSEEFCYINVNWKNFRQALLAILTNEKLRQMQLGETPMLNCLQLKAVCEKDVETFLDGIESESFLDKQSSNIVEYPVMTLFGEN
jgi:hypothetical protein